ncbi:response regulator [Inmirania thermothiophila]|uniref:Response regulator receiver domain-containing protein n=1 Tax=Inmirania thermothiophila TaxID=1750597 RepID=A0A3N1Y8U1_9GAMM|nr:response regulator [Inmirania thermothiophila]ROR35205.1 response regulator receiver domain-containing protein [Inmirania thermothiophila]
MNARPPHALDHEVLLLFSDDKDIVEHVAQMLEPAHRQALRLGRADEVVQLFGELEPGVLLYAFSRLELAERTHLDLYRNSERVFDVLHETVVLCEGGEVHDAWALCRRGIFDDYVVVRPLHDPHRLDMALRHALARLAYRRGSPSQGELRRLGEEIAALHRGLREALGRRGRLDERQAALLDGLQRRVREEGARLLEALQRDDRPTADGLLRRFAEEALPREVARVSAGIGEAVASWSGTLEAELEAHAPAVARLAEVASRARPAVLLVEDSEMDAEVVTAVLEEAGCRVMRCWDGASALSRLAEEPADLVLLDEGLPDLSGLDVLRRIRASGRLAELPVVMLTGRAEKEVVEGAIAAGASDFIRKPPARDLLLSRLQALLGRS